MKHNLTNPKMVAIIQARIGSTRLPRKVLKIIHGKTMLEHVIDRLKYCKLIDQIVVAIAYEEDHSISKLMQKCDTKIFMGNAQNVLDRYYQAAKKFQADIILRICSDCPLIDPQIVDRIIECFLQRREQLDYVSNTLNRTFPRGLDAEIFSRETLERTWLKARKSYEREHVTPYIYQHPKEFRLANVKNDINLSHLRWTVDTAKDLELIREIYRRLYKVDKIFLMNDILRVLKIEPDLIKISKYTKQKAFKE